MEDPITRHTHFKDHRIAFHVGIVSFMISLGIHLWRWYMAGENNRALYEYSAMEFFVLLTLGIAGLWLWIMALIYWYRHDGRIFMLILLLLFSAPASMIYYWTTIRPHLQTQQLHS